MVSTLSELTAALDAAETIDVALSDGHEITLRLRVPAAAEIEGLSVEIDKLVRAKNDVPMSAMLRVARSAVRACVTGLDQPLDDDSAARLVAVAGSGSSSAASPLVLRCLALAGFGEVAESLREYGAGISATAQAVNGADREEGAADPLASGSTSPLERPDWV